MFLKPDKNTSAIDILQATRLKQMPSKSALEDSPPTGPAGERNSDRKNTQGLLKGAFKTVLEKRKLENKRYIIFGRDLTLYGVSRSLNEFYGISNKFCYGLANQRE